MISSARISKLCAKTGMIYYGIVGLQIDCSAMVKSGRIKESDMLNRNWAYWTTFCQVRLHSL